MVLGAYYALHVTKIPRYQDLEQTVTCDQDTFEVLIQTLSVSRIVHATVNFKATVKPTVTCDQDTFKVLIQTFKCVLSCPCNSQLQSDGDTNSQVKQSMT